MGESKGVLHAAVLRNELEVLRKLASLESESARIFF